MRVLPANSENVARAAEILRSGGIVALSPKPTLLRPGAIAPELIEALTGPLARERSSALRSPGQLPVHYAPRTPLRVVEPANVPLAQRKDAAVLALRGPFDGYAAARILSATGDLREAAARLFDALHELDSLGLGRVDAQPVPESGLGLAIMDRLRRAAADRES